MEVFAIQLGAYSLGILAAVLATILFGLTNVVYKAHSTDVRVLEISNTRVWISLPLAVLLVLLPIRATSFSMTAQAAIALSFSMIVGIVMGDAAYFMSQNRIGVSRAFPIAMSYPLLVYTLAATYLSEPILPFRVFGAFLVVGGVGLIARTKGQMQEDSALDNKRKAAVGIALALVTAVLWAVGEVVLQFGLTTVDAVDGYFVRMLAGSLFLLPTLPFSMSRARRPSRKLLVLLLVTGIIGMGFSMALGTFAVKYIGATVSSIIVASAPLITTPLSVFYLGEQVTKPVAGGTIMTFAGIVLVILGV